MSEERYVVFEDEPGYGWVVWDTEYGDPVDWDMTKARAQALAASLNDKASGPVLKGRGYQ